MDLDTLLLQKLLAIRSPSGNEKPMHDFILEWVSANQGNFRAKPRIFSGDVFQDCIAVVFGRPRTAFFAHMDTVGYMVRYGDELIEVGSPEGEDGDILHGEDSRGFCRAVYRQNKEYECRYEAERKLDRGTELTFASEYAEDSKFISSAYLDNRIGIWNLLELAKTMENGILAFSCWEEQHGGSAAVLARFAFEEFKVNQVIVSDVTYVTEGIKHGDGAVISMRDAGIPRRSYVQRVMEIAGRNKIPFQIEVEGGGSSDGNEIQRIPYPIDWCFVGTPCANMHSPREKVLKSDVEAMHALYRYLASDL
jgi:putative aminopeptidase FrvX